MTDWRRRVVANPWARSATIRGNTATIYGLSPDLCQEDGEASIPGLPCTPVPASDRDRVEAYWGWDYIAPESTRFSDELNRASGRLPLAIGADGGNSMTFPGLFLRFRSGPAATYSPSPGWSTLLRSPAGEDLGFLLNHIDLHPSSPAAAGHPFPLTLVPYERVTGALIGGVAYSNTDAVHFLLDPAYPRQTVAVWLDSASPSPSISVYARCGATPTPVAFDRSGTVSRTVPAFLDLSTWGTCPSGWRLAVVNFRAEHASFHLRIGAHNAGRELSNVPVGILYTPATPEEDAAIRRALREGAWRFYGATGGTQLVRSYTYRAGCGDRFDHVRICVNRFCTRSHADPITGNIELCLTDFPVGTTPTESNVHDWAATLSHEWGHVFTGYDAFHWAADEYWDTGSVDMICGHRPVTAHRCLHSLMGRDVTNLTSFCTAANHRAAVEVLEGTGASVSYIGVTRGTSTPYECAGGERGMIGPTHADSVWTSMSSWGTIPVAHPPWGSDNHSFVNFADSTLTAIGRNLN